MRSREATAERRNNRAPPPQVATMARLSAVVLALAAPAGALVAPAAPKATVKVQGVSDMIGGTIETAGLWDPLRLSDGASDEQLHRWRCVELKHGRVAMAATVGLSLIHI